MKPRTFPELQPGENHRADVDSSRAPGTPPCAPRYNATSGEVPLDADRILWRRRVAYIAALLALTAGYPILPEPGRRMDLLLASCLCVPVVSSVLGRARIRDRRPWWLLCGSVVTFLMANLAQLWVVVVPVAQPLVTVSRIGACALAFATAVAVVARSRHVDAGALIDGMIVFMAAAGLLWSTVILPRLVATQQGPAVQMSTFVTVFGLGALAGALAQLVRTTAGRPPTLWLLVVGLTGPLLSQTVVVLRSGPASVAAAMIWLVALAALGLFGLDPAAPRLLEHTPATPHPLTAGRLVLRGAALATVPLVLGIQELASPRVGGPLLAVAGATIAALATIRSGRSAVEHARNQRALLHRATHDPLTGLPNRAEFMTRLEDELQGPYGCLVLFCDLDGFKKVNDRFGHAAGDRVLVEVTRRLSQCVREHDTVARFGGDEFLILYREAGPTDAEALRDRITLALAPPVELDGGSVVVSASVGTVVGLPQPGGEPAEARAHQLIHQADTEMYAAKLRRLGPGPRPGAAANGGSGATLLNTATPSWNLVWRPADVDTTMSFPRY